MLSMVNRIRNEAAKICLKCKQCPLRRGAKKGDTYHGEQQLRGEMGLNNGEKPHLS